MNIKLLFTKYLEFVKEFRREGTFHYYRKSFKLLEVALDELEIYETKQFNEDSYKDIIIKLKASTNKKNSKINDCMATFITAINYSKIKYNFNIIKLRDDTTPYKILNDNELKILKDYLLSLDLNKSNNLVWVSSIFITLDTGVRKNELLNIKTKNVDLTRNTIYLEITKTSKRYVKFGNLSKKYIALIYDKTKEYLLHNILKNKPLNRHSIEKFLDKVNKELKFISGNITLHRLRKTLATKLFIKGMPLPSIQRILGHSTIEMTMKYIDVSSLTLDKHYKEFYPY